MLPANICNPAQTPLFARKAGALLRVTVDTCSEKSANAYELQNKVQNKQRGGNPHYGLNVFDFAGADLEDNPREHAEHNAV